MQISQEIPPGESFHSFAASHSKGEISMKFRTIFRIILITLGVIELVLYVSEGFADHSRLIGAGIPLFISATNFCTQCPLLSVVTRYFRKKDRKEIPVTHI